MNKENSDMGIIFDLDGLQNYMIIPMLIGQELPRDEVDRMGNWKEHRYREIIAEHLGPNWSRRIS
jgi:hypothetical protein